jgi:hypothetical protein
MKGNVIPFPKPYLTTKDKSDIIVNDISLKLLDLLEQNNINTTRQGFILDMAWVVKFLEVTVDNSFGVENPLSKHIRQFVPTDLYETTQK